MNTTRKALLLIIFVMISSAISALLAWGSWRIIEVSSQKQFIRDASNYANAIELALQAKLHELNAVHGLFVASEQVDRQEFNTFVKRILHGDPRVSAIQWLPRQMDGWPPDPETQAGSHIFHLVDPAGKQPDWRFPVTYSHPDWDQLYPVSPDAQVASDVEKAMQRAMRDGEPKILLHSHRDANNSTDHPYDLDIIWPVFASNGTMSAVGGTGRPLVGFLRSRSELWFVIEWYIKELFAHPGGIDIFVFDDSEYTNNKLIFHHFSRARTALPPVEEIHEARLREEFHFLKDFVMLDQPWRIVMRPVRLDSFAVHSPWYPWAIGGSGMAITLLVAYYLYAFMHNANQVRILAEEKSAALRESEERLEQLQASEHRYRSVTESAQDGIVTVDDQQIILSWNRGAENIFGYSSETIVGQPLSTIIALEEWTRLSPEAAPVMPKGEVRGQRWDGSDVPLEITRAWWREKDRFFMTAIIRDITGWKSMLEGLRQAKEIETQANQAKSSFLANMSHEIRTPMNGILGMAELLLLTPTTSEQREYLEIIQESGRNLISIINNILDYSKIEAQRMELEEVEFDLGHVLHNLSVMFGELARRKGLTLTTRIAPHTPKILCADPHRINQILVNLLGNAVKFTA
ncbi:MAG: PAS domain S-box protein, partial [Magnetococcales bacterium]|nr:PAS domain S-box protein [Magnetococcales bacterium]